MMRYFNFIEYKDYCIKMDGVLLFQYKILNNIFKKMNGSVSL